MTRPESRTHFVRGMIAGVDFQKNLAASQRTIKQVIQAAAEGIEESPLKTFSHNTGRIFEQTCAMLGFLAECYSRQIYSSTTMASLATRDPEFIWLWGEKLPDAGVFRSFLETQPGAVHRCLTAMLRFKAEQKILAGKVTKVDGYKFIEEASRRMIMAAFVDSLELGGE